MAGSNFIEHASFSGHESFALRYLWLKKGYDALADNPEFFQRDDAMVILGVGKNMVRSIRHWGLLAKFGGTSLTVVVVIFRPQSLDI